MLHHEERSEAPTTGGPVAEGEPAAQVRVTAEEFARAVARYQARRDLAAQRMEGTVAIGDAVHELGLEATPEEILAEVQAERAAAAERMAQTARHPSSPRLPRFLAATVAASVLLVPVGMFFLRTAPTTDPAIMVAVQMPAPSPLVTLSAAPTVLVQDTSRGRPVLRTLAEVPDGVPVRCALDVTASRAAFANFSNADTAWTLIKHGGHLYARGWIASMSPQAIRTSAISLYCQRSLVPSGFAPTPATVPLDGLQTNPALGSDDTIVAEHVRPDAHFTERW